MYVIPIVQDNVVYLFVCLVAGRLIAYQNMDIR